MFSVPCRHLIFPKNNPANFHHNLKTLTNIWVQFKFLYGANNVKKGKEGQIANFSYTQGCSDGSKTGEALAEDASLSATSPQHLCGLVTCGKFHITLSGVVH